MRDIPENRSPYKYNYIIKFLKIFVGIIIFKNKNICKYFCIKFCGNSKNQYVFPPHLKSSFISSLSLFHQVLTHTFRISWVLKWSILYILSISSLSDNNEMVQVRHVPLLYSVYQLNMPKKMYFYQGKFGKSEIELNSLHLYVFFCWCEN